MFLTVSRVDYGESFRSAGSGRIVYRPGFRSWPVESDTVFNVFVTALIFCIQSNYDVKVKSGYIDRVPGR